MAFEWDRAGYTNQHGAVSKPIPATHLVIPGVIELTDQSIVWELMRTVEFEPTSRAAPPTLLNQFVKLWRLPDTSILAFARKFGVLWRGEGEPQCKINVSGREHSYRWRRASLRYCALLNIAADVQTGEEIRIEEWRYVGAFEEKFIERLKKPAQSRSQLAHEVRGMLYSSGLGFTIDLHKAKSAFTLAVDYRGCMLNAVLLQLVLTLSNSDCLVICSGCSLPYARSREKRRPRPGQSNYCDECGTTVALRHADQRRKKKMAEARQLFRDGEDIASIASKLETSVASVRNWVKGQG